MNLAIIDFGAIGGEIKDRLDHVAFGWTMREDFYRHMAGQLRNDIGQLTALERFQQRLARKKKNSSAQILTDIIRRMNDGSQFAAAMRRWVPHDEALILMGGEKAGKLSDAFDLIIDSKNRVKAVRRTFMTALATPVVYLFALYGLIWSIGVFVLPSIETGLPESAVQGTAKLLFTMGHAATSYWLLLPFGLLLGAIGWVIWALPNWTHPWRIKIEKYFPFSFYRDIQGFIWVLTFAAMLQAGMSDTKIMDDQAQHASRWLSQRLLAVKRRMLNGKSLAASLVETNYGFPNPDIIDDIESMSDFTDFPVRIATRARQWADELQWKTTKNVKVMGFVFDIIMFALILFVLVGINGLSTQMGNMPNL